MNDGTVVTSFLSENLKKWNATDKFDSSEKSIKKTELGDL